MANPRPAHNPPNPYESTRVVREDAEWDEQWNAEWSTEWEAAEARVEVHEEHAKTILSENDSPDVGFRFSLNPYRGCFHACTYCYARPTHQYWGFGAGTDFERKIIAKVNAPELLEKKLRSRGWKGDAIAFSGNTDCYQPLEASYRLTRRCLEVCLAHGNPVGVITKGTVIRRDVALLAELGRRGGCRVSISLAFSDDDVRKRFDPQAPPVEARLETMRRIADAGVPVGVAISPIIPGVNDSMIPEILERARDAGATTSFITLVRLSREVAPYFDVRLDELYPERASKVRNGISELRGGRANDTRFGHRMSGQGARWDAIARLYEMTVKRLGLNEASVADDLGPPPDARPRGQLGLF